MHFRSLILFSHFDFVNEIGVLTLYFYLFIFSSSKKWRVAMHAKMTRLFAVIAKGFSSLPLIRSSEDPSHSINRARTMSGHVSLAGALALLLLAATVAQGWQHPCDHAPFGFFFFPCKARKQNTDESLSYPHEHRSLRILINRIRCIEKINEKLKSRNSNKVAIEKK